LDEKKWDAMNPPEDEKPVEDEETKERIRQIHEKPDISTMAAQYHEYHDYTKDYKKESNLDAETKKAIDQVSDADVQSESDEDEEDEEDDLEDLMIKNEPVTKRGPYRVLPERYGAFESFDKVELEYYTDGVLAEEDGEIVDIDAFVGEEQIQDLIDIEEEEIFVCNPRYGCYYHVTQKAVPFFPDQG
jgi:hypothetical protein